MNIYEDSTGRDRVSTGTMVNIHNQVSINEVLKERERKAKEEREEKDSQNGDPELSLDSTERVKVLSPGQLVFKRFITNKLAIVGSLILIFMFLFAFVMPLFYPYSQTQIFYKYDNSTIDYAQAKERTEYSLLLLNKDADVHYSVKNKLTATISAMESKGIKEQSLTDTNGNSYKIEKNADNIYSLYSTASEKFAAIQGSVKYATYSTIGAVLTYEDDAEEVTGLAEAIKSAISGKNKEFTLGKDVYTLEQNKKTYNVYRSSEGINYFGDKLGADFEEKVAEFTESGSFEFDSEKYNVVVDKDGTTVYRVMGEERIALLSTYVFDTYDPSFAISEDFEIQALLASVGGKTFNDGNVNYRVVSEEDETLIYSEADDTNPVAAFSTMVIRRYTGEDTLELAFKEQVRSTIEEMVESGKKSASFTWQIAQVDENGEYTYDENGELIKEDRNITVNDKNGTYVMTVEQVVYLINTFERPTKDHLAGTDGDGMDVLARMMYGGRVSLMVAFVVVIIENVLGIIMGGIAGYFGGWIDNLIMRAVDIFYCIPSMPILIILGAMFDAFKLKPYTRLVWMMAVLGVLGWAGVARLVRGQILSLREQEFMVAAEAIGLRNQKRIFRHLIPNVMPQLIVTATSGLGGVIITESTLSYLGLGVKHPLASWGTMINSVSTAEAMKSYTYIWVPVGLLICLTVVAFNFVGDGLRDAFDPKMKR